MKFRKIPRNATFWVIFGLKTRFFFRKSCLIFPLPIPYPTLCVSIPNMLLTFEPEKIIGLLVVMGEDLQPIGHGFESRRQILDGV